MKLKSLIFLSTLISILSTTVNAAPTSPSELQSAIEKSLTLKDQKSFTSLYNWEGVNENMKNQQNQMISMIFNAGHNSVEMTPLPKDFRDEYVLNGIRLKPNVKIIGFMTLTGGGKTGNLTLGPVQIPYGTKGENFYLSNTVEESVSTEKENDISLNITIGGTSSPKPIRFKGFIVYTQNGKEIREEINGKGNKSLAVLGKHVNYCKVQKISKSGEIWLKVSEGGKVIFDSKEVKTQKPIIYKLR